MRKTKAEKIAEAMEMRLIYQAIENVQIPIMRLSEVHKKAHELLATCGATHNELVAELRTFAQSLS